MERGEERRGEMRGEKGREKRIGVKWRREAMRIREPIVTDVIIIIIIVLSFLPAFTSFT